MEYFLFSLRENIARISKFQWPVFLLVIYIALFEGMVQCKNLYIRSNMTEAWEITHQGNLFGKPWNVCMYIYQNISVQRLSIHNSKDEDYFVKCSKLDDSWSYTVGNGISRNRTVQVICPNKDDQTMCMTVSSGRKDDIGLLYFEMTDGLMGKTTVIYSEYFIYKKQEYPNLRSECIDRKNREITIDMDFVEDSEFSADAYYKDVFLCKLNRREWKKSLGLKNCSSTLACTVDYVLIENMKHNAAGQVVVVNTSEHINRNVTTLQYLRITNSCPSKEKGSSIGIVIAVVAVLLVIGVSITCFVRYKCNASKFNDITVISKIRSVLITKKSNSSGNKDESEMSLKS